MKRVQVLADADVLIDALEGTGAREAVETLLRERRLVIPAVAAFEVWCGTRDLGARAAFRKLFRGARVLPFDRLTAERAGAIYRAAELAGERIAHRDAMIAATALVLRAPLLTRNVSDFRRVAGLTLFPA